MSAAPHAHWPRAHYVDSGLRPELLYKVHGKFDKPPELSASRHRTRGVPAGLSLERHAGAGDNAVFSFGLDGVFGESLASKGAAVEQRTRQAPDCLLLRGQPDAPGSLDYLRDVVGLIEALLEQGGVAVFDPFVLRWWTRDEWHTELFEPDAPMPHRHVVILESDEDLAATHWYHTRGMRKFGRPDLSIRGVSTQAAPAAINVLDRFIELLAFGGLPAQGKAIRVQGLPDGLRCFLEGDVDDPDFNNTHLELRVPEPRDLILTTNAAALKPLLAPWHWLPLEGLEPFGATLFGDVLLLNDAGAVLMLDTVAGELRELASSRAEFDIEARSPQAMDEWFMADLAMDCMEAGMTLGASECLSFALAPVLSGELTLDNVHVCDLSVHHEVTAQVIDQVRDLPDGTPVHMADSDSD